MEDRLRYRAFHYPTRKIFDVYSFTDTEVFEDTFDAVGSSPTNPANMIDCKMLQCTGLKDKNGKLIYEGDLLKWSDYDKYPYLVRVSWCDLLCSFAFINEDSKFMANHLEPFWNKDVEVVGNVHENAKLLEE